MSDDALKRSVTKDDVESAVEQGAISFVLGPAGWGNIWGSGLLEGVKGSTGLPPYGSKQADMILSETVMIENMWSSAVNTAITKNVALGFELDDAGDSARRIKASQELLLQFDGNYNKGLAKHLRDYLTTDNGAFIEIVRATSNVGSKIIGLNHLDSLRCWRTGDPARPVVYVDSKGYQHVLRDEDVLIFQDMPSARTLYRDMGFSAARRSFETILKLTAIETYVREKVSGSRNLAIHIVNGISSQQLEGALISSGENQKQKGFVVYRGSTIIPMMKNETPSIVTIPLAEIPDGFNADNERKDAYLRYSNALGIFVGEIQPLSGQGFGTGTQSLVLEESAEGRGLASWRRQFMQQITHNVLPEATTFRFAVSDMKDRKARAETMNAEASALKVLVDAKIITPEQALNVLVDKDYLPKEFLQTDATTGGTVSDNESIASNSEVQRGNISQGTVPISVETDDVDKVPTVSKSVARIPQSKTFSLLQSKLTKLKQKKERFVVDSDVMYVKKPTGKTPGSNIVNRMIDVELPSALKLLEAVINVT